MLNRLQYWLLTALAVLVVATCVLNASLFSGNRKLQGEITSRQQFILQSVQLQGLYNEVAQALADLSARTNDEDLRRVLEARGITFSVNPPASGPDPARAKEGR